MTDQDKIARARATLSRENLDFGEHTFIERPCIVLNPEQALAFAEYMDTVNQAVATLHGLLSTLDEGRPAPRRRVTITEGYMPCPACSHLGPGAICNQCGSTGEKRVREDA